MPLGVLKIFFTTRAHCIRDDVTWPGIIVTGTQCKSSLIVLSKLKARMINIDIDKTNIEYAIMTNKEQFALMIYPKLYLCDFLPH